MLSLEESEDIKAVDRQQFVIFQIGQEEYGVNIVQAKEILKPTKITNVPNTKSHILGVINLRGQIVPVVDLRERIDIKGDIDREEQRIITVEVRDALIGLLVDSVNEVVWVKEEDIEPAPEVAGGIKQEFLLGVGKIGDHLLILIDLEELLFAKTEEE